MGGFEAISALFVVAHESYVDCSEGGECAAIRCLDPFSEAAEWHEEGVSDGGEGGGFEKVERGYGVLVVRRRGVRWSIDRSWSCGGHMAC